MKEQIANNYLENMKARHPAFPISPRTALVVGAEDKNIGAFIAKRLRGDGFNVDETIDDVLLPVRYRERFEGRICDTLVLSHGVTEIDWFENMTRLDFEHIINVNLVGTLNVINEFVRSQIGGIYKKHIVVIGSMAYKAVLNGSVAYCASKAGVAHAVKCLAWELAPKGFDVFAVHPSNVAYKKPIDGKIGPPMTEHTIQCLMRYRGLSREAAEAYWGASLPKQNWLSPEDIAEVVSWLVSGKAEYLSGSNIDLTGGQR